MHMKYFKVGLYLIFEDKFEIIKSTVFVASLTTKV